MSAQVLEFPWRRVAIRTPLMVIEEQFAEMVQMIPEEEVAAVEALCDQMIAMSNYIKGE